MNNSESISMPGVYNFMLRDSLSRYFDSNTFHTSCDLRPSLHFYLFSILTRRILFIFRGKKRSLLYMYAQLSMRCITMDV